jgi:hypothetical protein
MYPATKKQKIIKGKFATLRQAHKTNLLPRFKNAKSA